jgi:uncharacterized protein (DUF58 family)
MLVFDETFLRKLERLTLIADQVRVGAMKGERRSRDKGSSQEFADYRNYVQGDDLRRLDWNIYARLERPFVKLFEEEEDLTVQLLIDASASMDWPDGEIDLNKFQYALRLAGALGYIGLASGDQVTVALINGAEYQIWGPHRGRVNVMRMLEFLEKGTAYGLVELNSTLKRWSLRARRPGLLLLISDLFSPSGYEAGLNALQSRGYEVGVIHLLSPDEISPAVGDDVKLIDVETRAEAEISLDAATIGRYRDRLERWRSEIARACAGRGVHYVPVSTDLRWDRLILQTLRQKGVVR